MPNKKSDRIKPESEKPDDWRAWICDQHIMTLATASLHGTWSAPVYFIYQDNRFFFFSSTKSRHINDAMAPDAICAASIYEDQPRSDQIRFDQIRFDQIKGIQMSGKIEPAGKNKAALKAAVNYIRRFKIPVEESKGLAVIETTYHSRLFFFIASQVFCMDNSKGFGHRQEIRL